jgi:hypothetical protein
LADEANELRHLVARLEEEKAKWASFEAALKQEITQRDQSLAKYSDDINQKNLKIKDMMREQAEKDLTVNYKHSITYPCSVTSCR